MRGGSRKVVAGAFVEPQRSAAGTACVGKGARGTAALATCGNPFGMALPSRLSMSIVQLFSKLDKPNKREGII